MKRIYIPLTLFFVVLHGCGQDEIQYIELNESSPTSSYTVSPAKTEKSIVLALGAMTTPKRGYRYYKELSQYLEEKLGTVDNQWQT